MTLIRLWLLRLKLWFGKSAQDNRRDNWGRGRAWRVRRARRVRCAWRVGQGASGRPQLNPFAVDLSNEAVCVDTRAHWVKIHRSWNNFMKWLPAGPGFNPVHIKKFVKCLRQHKSSPNTSPKYHLLAFSCTPKFQILLSMSGLGWET